MTREAIYDRLRAIGVSVESADAVAEVLEPLPDKKVEAFVLWAKGMSQEQAALCVDMPRQTFTDCLRFIRQKSIFTG